MLRPDANCWVIDGNGLDPALFFATLPDAFPEATTFFVEGCAQALDVVRYLEHHAASGEFLPGANTILPVSRKVKCTFSREFALGLARLSHDHAEMELLEHLFLYRDRDYLLYWHDAFTQPMWVAGSLSEDRVRLFAQQLGRHYRASTARRPG